MSLKTIFALSCAIVSFSLQAQTPLQQDIEFEHISVPGTMTSALVGDITQDPLGIIWIGKQMLHRYDGKKFKTYGTFYPDSLPLNGHEITKLFWDNKKDRLLIGTTNHGLLQFRYEDNRITRLPSKSGTPFVTNIAQTPDGKIWISSFNNGLFTLDNDTLIRKFTLQDIIQPSALIVKDDDLWVGATYNITILHKGRVRKVIPLQDILPQWKGIVRVTSLCFDGDQIWIGTEKNGVVRFDPITQKTNHYFPPDMPPFYSPVLKIEKDKEGMIWMLSRNNGVALYNPSLNQFANLIHNPSITSSLSDNVCASVFSDAQGIVWVGSAGALNKYDKHKIRFRHFNHQPGNPASMSDNNVRGLYEGEDGLIWIATADGYLNLLNRKTRQVEKIKVSVPGYDHFITPFTICRFGKQLLISTSQGVLIFDRTSGKFNFFKPFESETKGKNTRQILKDGDWFYVQCQGTLIIYNDKSKQVRKVGRNEMLPGVSSLAVDSEHHLWLGNLGGVARYNPQDQSLQKIKLIEQSSRPDSSYFLVLSIEAKEKEIWVSTFNTGIFILKEDANGTYKIEKRLTTHEGLPDNAVYASMTDRKGNEWISTNNGLAFYDMTMKRVTSFGVNEGIQDEEFNRLAYLTTKNGEMIFGGVNGINIFNPDSISIVTNLAKPQIIGVSIFKNLSSDDSFEKYYALVKNNTKPQFDHSEKNLKFDFFVPDYRESNRYELYYRLDPLDASWNKSEGQNAAIYANLKPGEYTFTVRTLNAENEEITDAVSFTILPPFWNTWWFMLLSAAVVSLMLFTIVRDRIAATAAEKRRLAELLRVRTQEIERSKEELENLNRKKDLIFSILSHDLRSPLTTLKGFLGMLIDNSDSISKEELKKYSISIRNSVTNSLDLIDNTLYWSLSQTGTIQCNPIRVDLAPIFDKIKGLYQLTAEKKKLKFNIQELNGIAVTADENMLYVLIRNLVSNAIKFTPEGKSVFLEATKNGRWVEIKIKDEGVGMSESEIGKILTLDNPEVKRGTSSEKGTGLGLLLCKKFIEVNGGKLKINSREGTGSEFLVDIPYCE